MILFFLACLEPTSEILEPIPYGDPSIQRLSYECDEDAARWEFVAITDAWTSNGNIWLYSPPVLEKHPIYSVNSASDGTKDRLEITLNVVADWREASAGSSTQFHCDSFDDIGVRLYVYHPETSEAADCLTEGSEIEWTGSEAPDCTH